MTSTFNRFFIGLSILLLSSIGKAQAPTVGLLYSSNLATEGYTLFTPEGNSLVYLIDNCGQVINEWSFSESPALTCYLLPNGDLLRAGIDSLEIRDWNNNLVWSYATTLNGFRQHHDIEPMPNGNILCILGDPYPYATMLAQGRDPGLGTTNFKIDKIVELQPIGTNQAQVVWEWKMFNHLVQEYDSLKPNYGKIVDHPELINMNYPGSPGNEYSHTNAIDYNATLDQIIISCRALNEIYIIDHSTTTSQAAGHSGGNSNRGGDLLWRWGNPQLYGQGGSQDQKLFLQHDARWVNDNYLDASKISVFNNGGDSTNTFSAIHLIQPVFSGGSYAMTNNIFAPSDYDWSWNGSILGHVFYEKIKGGAFSLPNGNFLISETSLGQISEITKTGDNLWSYRNPSGSTIHNQFDSLGDDVTLFRAEKYPSSFSGFVGKDMSPKGLIEDQNALSDTCIMLSGIGSELDGGLTVVNPVVDGTILFSPFPDADAIMIFDMKGSLVFSCGHFDGNQLQTDLLPGLYLIQLQAQNRIITRKVVVQ